MSLFMCPGLEQLERFASGGFAEPDREVVQQHLAGCEACRARLNEIQANIALAARLQPRREPDSGLPIEPSVAETTDMAARVAWPEQLTEIGPYRVLSILGEGGFGVVYLAEQTSPVRRRVALKVIKPGMDSARVIARFEAERQALAMMDHPSIARVLDAGTTDKTSRPYFVMEHVPGESITTYADKHRLSTRARLELFIPVCEAVQHAHTKGVIHRDIKPGNVLVVVRDGQQPVPKVIDFGIAKALHGPLGERTIFTEQGQLIGTPEYMSPEQAEMGPLDIDTRSDVYSLGVMLYELLTGARPFDLRGASIMDMVKVIREQDPIHPSTRLTRSGEAAAKVADLRRTRPEALSRELKRELEWIPLKALKKDRTERYQSAADLARDVRNYLEGRALLAAPESAGYRLRKFVRRHKGPVVAAAAVVGALGLGLVGTLWQAREARREAVRADERANAAARAEEEQRRSAQSEADARRVADQKTAEAVKARETIEYNSYVANIQMAAAWLDRLRVDRARERLDACAGRLRNWEWRWLTAEADNSLLVLPGHSDKVTCVGYSPDGRHIVTASWDHTARVWDATTGTSVAELKGHTKAINFAAFSGDGSRIVTASNDMTSRVWTVTGASVAELVGHTAEILSAAFSPDGSRIATASGDRTARVWDASTGSIITELKGHGDGVSSAAFSADGLRIVSASRDKTACVWDAADGSRLAELKGHTNLVWRAEFSPDGKRVVTAAVDQTARVWDAATGKSLAELNGHSAAVVSAAFSADGKRVITASQDGTARVWEAATGTIAAELRGHSGVVWTASFDTDGKRVVTASQDGTARVWDAASGRTLATLLGHGLAVTDAKFSPDGNRIVAASWDGTARVWDAATSANFAELRAGDVVRSAAFSPDGRRVITSSDRIARVWDAATGRSIRSIRGHTSDVLSAAFSPDGTRVVTASRDKTARVSDAASGSLIATLKGHTGEVLSAVFSPDGTQILTASKDETSRFWDAATGAGIAEPKQHADPITSAAIGPDGTRVVTSHKSGIARLWDAATGSIVVELRGHSKRVCSAGFSPDGRRIVTASDDNTSRVWDTKTGTCIAELKGHVGALTCASFNGDGTRVITASFDGDVRVWDAETGADLVAIQGHSAPVNSVAFSPDGTRIVTASWDLTARIWDSVPYRTRHAERQANARGEDGSAIIKALLRQNAPSSVTTPDVSGASGK